LYSTLPSVSGTPVFYWVFFVLFLVVELDGKPKRWWVRELAGEFGSSRCRGAQKQGRAFERAALRAHGGDGEAPPPLGVSRVRPPGHDRVVP
jgi:hypothetical protein